MLFATVDPYRDTLPALKQYAAAFAPQVDGLRGSDNALASLARRYRVAYSVKTEPVYEVMHTSVSSSGTAPSCTPRAVTRGQF